MHILQEGLVAVPWAACFLGSVDGVKNKLLVKPASSREARRAHSSRGQIQPA